MTKIFKCIFSLSLQKTRIIINRIRVKTQDMRRKIARPSFLSCSINVMRYRFKHKHNLVIQTIACAILIIIISYRKKLAVFFVFYSARDRDLIELGFRSLIFNLNLFP